MYSYRASLRVAADENDLKKLKSTIETGNCVLDGETASEIAQRASSHGNLDIVRYLAEMEPAVLDKDAHLASTRAAVEKGHLNVVRYLVEKEPPSVTTVRYWGCHTGDMYKLAEVAARNQHLDILLCLAKKEADIGEGYEAEDKYSGKRRYALKLAIKEDILDEKTLKTLSSVPHYRIPICKFAAEVGNLAIVRYFVERYPSVLEEDPAEDNIAHAAAYHSQWNVFWYVIEKNPSLLMDSGSCSHFPLFMAIKNKGATVAQLKRLVQENKVQLDVTDRFGNNIAHAAAKGGNLDIIIYIEETEPSILHGKGHFMRTVVEVAVEKGSWEIVRYLAVRNPSVYTAVHKVPPTYKKCSIFYEAVRNNSMDQGTLKYLLESQKIPLNLRESLEDSGNLAQLSIKNENPDIFHYLVQKEPSLLSDKVKGMGTVGHVAGQKRYLTGEIISTAVDETPSLFAQKDDTKGNTFLHLAIEQSLVDVKTLEKLLNGKFVTLTEVNNEGDTLAHAAASAEQNSSEGQAGTGSAKNSQIIAYIAKKQGSILAWKNCHGDTAALTAARKGHLSVLREIARVNPSTILKLDRQQNSVLHLLAATETQLGALPDFEMLVRRGLPLMGTNWQGDTSTHIAARNGFVELIEFAIREEPTVVRVRNAAGRNVVLAAAENACYNVIECIPDKKLLLERDNSGNTILHLILQCDTFDPSEFTEAFQNVTIPVDLFVKPNRDGVNVVHLAAQVGCLDIIERIAKEKSSILYDPTHNGTSVLQHAVKYSQLEVIKKILSSNEKYGAQNIHALFQFHNETEVFNIVRDFEIKNDKMSVQDRRNFDETAIHFAIESGYWTILKHLIRYRKVDVNQPNAVGEPPIFIAVRFKHFDMFKYLVERPGINLALTDYHGNNILFVALEMDDDLSTLKYVLDEKKIPLDVNWRNEAGDTILHRALRNAIRAGKDYHSETIHYLIERKRANINLPGLQNRTAIMYAGEHKRFDICNYLLDLGADPYFRNDLGKNFWDVSRFHVKQRRSVEAVAASMIHHSHEPRIDYNVPRVLGTTQSMSEPLFANYHQTSLSLSGLPVLAHVLLQYGRGGRRPSKHPTLNPSLAEELYAKLDPIAVDAVFGNRRD